MHSYFGQCCREDCPLHERHGEGWRRKKDESGWAEHDVRISVPFKRDTTRARAHSARTQIRKFCGIVTCSEHWLSKLRLCHRTLHATREKTLVYHIWRFPVLTPGSWNFWASSTLNFNFVLANFFSRSLFVLALGVPVQIVTLLVERHGQGAG